MHCHCEGSSNDDDDERLLVCWRRSTKSKWFQRNVGSLTKLLASIIWVKHKSHPYLRTNRRKAYSLAATMGAMTVRMGLLLLLVVVPRNNPPPPSPTPFSLLSNEEEEEAWSRLCGRDNSARCFLCSCSRWTPLVRCGSTKAATRTIPLLDDDTNDMTNHNKAAAVVVVVTFIREMCLMLVAMVA